MVFKPSSHCFKDVARCAPSAWPRPASWPAAGRRARQDDTHLGLDVGKADQDAGGPCGHGVVSGQVGAWRVGLGVV